MHLMHSSQSATVYLQPISMEFRDSTLNF